MIALNGPKGRASEASGRSCLQQQAYAGPWPVWAIRAVTGPNALA